MCVWFGMSPYNVCPQFKAPVSLHPLVVVGLASHWEHTFQWQRPLPRLVCTVPTGFSQCWKGHNKKHQIPPGKDSPVDGSLKWVGHVWCSRVAVPLTYKDARQEAWSGTGRGNYQAFQATWEHGDGGFLVGLKLVQGRRSRSSRRQDLVNKQWTLLGRSQEQAQTLLTTFSAVIISHTLQYRQLLEFCWAFLM